MQGRKRAAFLLDLSYIGWYALGVFTFGALFYFYVNPLRYASWAAFFEAALCEAGVTVPYDQGATAEHRARIDWRRDYAPVNLVLMFFIFSFIGWAWEMIYFFAQGQGIINRGTLYGPWLPIYGAGGVGALLAFKSVRERPLAVFLLSMLACGILEWVTATVLWNTLHLKYWDYTGFFLNIQGRTCLEGLLVFGAGCSAGIYVIAPVLDHNLNTAPLKRRRVIACILIALFVVDLVCTAMYPRSGPGITL
jgi:hypothetical protein